MGVNKKSVEHTVTTTIFKGYHKRHLTCLTRVRNRDEVRIKLRRIKEVRGIKGFLIMISEEYL